MRVTSPPFLAAVAVVVAVGWHFFQDFYVRHNDDPPSPCVVDPVHTANATTSSECFFSSTFHQATALFKEASGAAGADSVVGLEVEEHHNITVAVFEGDPSNNGVVLHISGTHGAEGYVGSAIQSAWLNAEITRKKNINVNSDSSKTGPTIILVHALNPVGMAQMRRVNENNVDLNRNCFVSNSQTWPLTQASELASGYAAVDPFLNPPHPAEGVQRWQGIFGLLKHIYRVGWVVGKRALVTGQYSHPKGIFYGGTELATSHQKLSSYLKEIPQVAAAKRLVLVDVHSGIGPPGRDTLMTSDADLSNVQQNFGSGSEMSDFNDVRKYPTGIFLNRGP